MIINRYKYILILFIVLLFYGQKVPAASPFAVNQDIYQLYRGNSQYIIYKNVPTKLDQAYRLNLALRQLPADLAARAVQPASSSPTLTVRRESAYKGEEVIGRIELKDNADWQYQSVIFTGTGTEELISLVKDDSSAYSSIAVRVLDISAVDSSAISTTTVFGSSTETVAGVLGDSGGTKTESMLGVDRAYSQVFKAVSDSITSVKLPLTFRGNGGGDYELAIYSTINNNGTFSFDKKMAGFAINRSTVAEYVTADGQYKLPLPARLILGNSYALVIDGSAARVNPFHYMLLTVTSRGEGLYQLRRPVGELNRSIGGQLVASIYGRSAQTSVGGIPLLQGEVIEDLGSVLQTSYSLVPDMQNPLDIHDYSFGVGNSGQPFYSQRDGMLEAEADKDASYSYQIPLGGNLMQAEIAYKTSDPTNDAVQVSYSLDGKNYQKVKPSAWSREGQVVQTISGPANVVWIEVSYHPINDKETVFGLESLNLVARVAK